ncbi:mitochondrial 54S ribosomal protein uL4m KNAG_0B03480 [Huiozyma naganishii CBS 8797]|uniref:Large ribosomal subunit protein uL4m n=1 Tax=Huiozyma naganishii (strain ATCC MYA-139 / BCRC 22969 / CBS 8797 / KCTC 17520 / NBRC 10181 / NCYC 3082 / Yp74L-3) TaxID=1071383 RepID=J7R1U9_HUIN7|nr:hypothetical protein KNAG_0B03480 [Kazachstania naganishii CBS 8797]CCK68790.1 hypothetical protein KNAG_0B03480 [Kazachstania naganishii CBS 8797]
MMPYKPGNSLLSRCVRFQSTGGRTAQQVLPNFALPPRYALVSLRAFPSLEPISCIPIPTPVLNAPLRRDILWRAVVYENNNRRVGSSNPPGRSENGYSRHKIRPQKGTGHARTGDANSPTRHTGDRALARSAPNDYTTDLPRKIYALAFNCALSQQYKKGNIYVIGGSNAEKVIELPDMDKIDIVETSSSDSTVNYIGGVFEKFLKENNFEGKRLLFVTNEPRENLIRYTDRFKKKVDIATSEAVEVNDILKASKVFIEVDALKYLAEKYSQSPSNIQILQESQ